MQYAPLLRRLIAGEDIGQSDAASIVGEMMDGSFSAVQAAGIVTALAAKGETLDEVTGAARAMRERSCTSSTSLRSSSICAAPGATMQTINMSTSRRSRRRGRHPGCQARQPRGVERVAAVPTCSKRGWISRRNPGRKPRAGARSRLRSCSRRATIRRCKTSRRCVANWASVPSSTSWT